MSHGNFISWRSTCRGISSLIRGTTHGVAFHALKSRGITRGVALHAIPSRVNLW